MKFTPRGELVLLKVTTQTHTKRGIEIPEQSQKLNIDNIEVVAVGKDVTEMKAGDKVLLHHPDMVLAMPSVSDILFKIPGDETKYILVSEIDLAGKL